MKMKISRILCWLNWHNYRLSTRNVMNGDDQHHYNEEFNVWECSRCNHFVGCKDCYRVDYLVDKKPVVGEFIVEAEDFNIRHTYDYSLIIQHGRGFEGEGFRYRIVLTICINGFTEWVGDIHYGKDEGTYSLAVDEGIKQLKIRQSVLETVMKSHKDLR